ncbi:MAG: AAA family ATPase [Bacteroidota bacterium]
MGSTEFLVTKEYRRFEEFCNACFREKYIGICYGPPGVGKTLSAKHYSKEDGFNRFFNEDTPEEEAIEIGEKIVSSRTIFYTATVMNTPKRIEADLEKGRYYLFSSLYDIEKKVPGEFPVFRDDYSALVIVDEADRLHLKSLEQVRAIYDERGDWGFVLIGMPGIEKRLARYPQLYSRVGFAHEYRPIGKEEMMFILEHHWGKLGLELDRKNFADTEAVAAVARITNGNFRLIHRLFSQVKRIMEVNRLTAITKEVVEAARDCLVIGNI